MDPLPPTSTLLVGRFRTAARWFAAGTGAIGVLGLADWFTGNRLLAPTFASGITIKTNTAVALILGGAAALLLAPEERSRLRTAAGRAAAALMALIGAATLSQHLTGWDLGIDQILFREAPGAAGTQSPNRMGPPASICFPLLGLALLLADRRTRSGWSAAQRLAVVAMLIALLPVLGYAFQVRELYGLARYTGIALHTAVAFLLLGAAILSARPTTGAMRLLLAEDSGGLMLRRLLPAALLLPVALAWARTVGEEAGLYDTRFGRSVLVLGMIVAFSALVWWTARAVSAHAGARARAEAAEGELRDRLVRSLESERRARAAAEHSNRMKDEFLATLSHELRTPLQAILGWSRLLLRGGMTTEDARRGVETIDRNARHQAQLIEDLLDMSRIISGRISLELQDVDLALVVGSAVAAVTPAAEAKGIRLERRVPASVLPVRGDPARLQQVLWNLLTNAIKFTPRGGGVEVHVDQRAGHVEATVQDTGEGIRPEMLERIFDRFSQADSSTTRRHGGLGIGLSIARQLTELHGGSLQADSAGEGRGATFTVRLPVTPALSMRPPAPPPPPAAAAAGSLAGTRVLVVDDQADSRALIERILVDLDAEVLAADGVQTALDCLERDRVDVVVSDIAMPDRDGYELMRELRARRPDLPAIALTAFARAEDRDRALAAGYRLHLPKPVDPAALGAAVARLAAEAAGAR